MLRIASAAVLTASLFSIAAASASVQEAPKRKGSDPNEVVCKKEAVLGSRLQTRKVCMTRSEWAGQRQADRENVERSQTNTCQRQAGC
ncbi:hypothetical protein AB2M62_19755 [Sphingomonas sp. MMS12-HWE2-04]|uniref:hypothetical protein n=1 Tax=Sphingomonas sp. MMS12-HWE2-04 TaxID=3234199 RepID=UPI0038503EE7